MEYFQVDVEAIWGRSLVLFGVSGALWGFTMSQISKKNRFGDSKAVKVQISSIHRKLRYVVLVVVVAVVAVVAGSDR